MPESAPPSRLRRARVPAALALTLVVAGLSWSAWAGWTRTLHVVNATSQTAQLSLPNGRQLEVPPGQRVEVRLGEGEHALTVNDEPLRVSMRVGFWQRYTRRPLFLLNVGGAALLVRQETVYGAVDLEAAPDRVLLGTLVAEDRVDYAFEPFPEEAPRQGLAVRVSWFRGHPAELAAALPPDDPQSLLLLEQALARDPDDARSLRAWSQRLTSAGDDERELRGLGAGLSARPVRVLWHRLFQDAQARAGEHEALLARYDALLAEAPTDPDRLYLRGRLAARPAEAIALYRRATAGDPEHHAAWRGLAVQLAGLGRWDEAWEACVAAGDAQDPDLAELRFRVRLARGDLKALAEDLDAARRERELDPNLLRRELELLVQSGDLDAARQAQRRYALAARQLGDDPQQLGLLSELWLAELLGQGEPLLVSCQALRDPRRRQRLESRGLALTGQLEQAAERLGDAPDPWRLLELALAAVAQGRDPAPWLSRVRERAAQGGPRDRVLVRVLDGEQGLDQVVASPLERAALAVVLATLRPARRGELLEAARALTRRPAYPAASIRAALERLR